MNVEIAGLRVGLADMLFNDQVVGQRVDGQHLTEVIQNALVDDAVKTDLM